MRDGYNWRLQRKKKKKKKRKKGETERCLLTKGRKESGGKKPAPPETHWGFP